MASSSAALSQLLLNKARATNISTRKALIVLDLQNDFVHQSSGKLPVTLLDGFQDHLVDLTAAFRNSASEVVWVTTEFDSPQPVDQAALVPHVESEGQGDKEADDGEDSEEEMLTNSLAGKHTLGADRPSASRMAAAIRRNVSRKAVDPHETSSLDAFLSQAEGSNTCCLPGSEGSHLCELALSALDISKDLRSVKNTYSAFDSRNSTLLTSLRSKLVTELYLCGSLTNISVYATASDAVRHGFEVYVVDDCLGFRNLQVHEEALTRMTDIMGALRLSARECIAQVQGSKLASVKEENSNKPQVAGILSTVDPDSYTDNPSEKLDSGSYAPNSSQIPNISYIGEYDASPQENRGPPESALFNLPIRTKEEVTDLASNNTTPSLSSRIENLKSKSNAAPGNISKNSQSASNGAQKMSKRSRGTTHPTLGPDDSIGEGDSYVVYDVIPSFGPKEFYGLKNEVYWQKMSHAQGEVPRLVCTQGLIDQTDGSMPVYRHPSDQSLPLLHFSHIIGTIKKRVEAIVCHPMNHVLIQIYRSGQDNISEHSDKTLDIVRGSSIVNVSLGAQRTMRLRTKKSASYDKDNPEGNRKTQLVPLPNGSVFVLGPKTNMNWLHGINADKRPLTERSQEELAVGCERISLTFRHIGTFLDAKCKLIWGQGACKKDRAEAQPVINGDPELKQKMINAFGFENQQSRFDWDAVYGHGFDVLHFNQSTAKAIPHLFLSGNPTDDERVKIYLEEIGISYCVTGVRVVDAGLHYSPKICFRDSDVTKTQVYDVDPVLKYLRHVYSSHEVSEVVTA